MSDAHRRGGSEKIPGIADDDVPGGSCQIHTACGEPDRNCTADVHAIGLRPIQPVGLVVAGSNSFDALRVSRGRLGVVTVALLSAWYVASGCASAALVSAGEECPLGHINALERKRPADRGRSCGEDSGKSVDCFIAAAPMLRLAARGDNRAGIAVNRCHSAGYAVLSDTRQGVG